MCWGPCGPVGLLRCWGACGPFDVGLLGPKGPLRCWGGYPCRRRNSIRPTGRHHRWRIHVPGYDHSSLAGCLEGVCNTPLPGSCIGTCAGYVHSGTRPNSPASADARGFAAQGFALGYGPAALQAAPGYVHSGIRPASLPRQGPSADARAFLRSDRNKCTSSSCFYLRILVRLRGQRSIRKTCVSIRNITYFISPVHMAGMFILQAPYLLPISSVCFPRCSRNPRAVNNPSRRN